MASLNAGKHVLCEEPMGMNADEVREMVACAKKNNKFLMEAFWSRFWPAYDQLRSELFDKKSIGDVKMVTASFGRQQPPDRLEKFTRPDCGGSALMAIGCYPVMFACLAFNGERPESIQAVGHLTEHNMDLTGCIILKYSGDRMAQLSYTFTSDLICDGTVVGSNKKFLKLPTLFWCPLKLETSEKVYYYDLPNNPEKLSFVWSRGEGFSYEAACVRKCIMEGLRECRKMKLDESILISEIMTECRKQIGVSFQQGITHK